MQFPNQKYHILNQKFSETELTPNGTALLLKLLRYDPERRISARTSISHAYFTTEKPRPKEESAMPTFKPTQELAHKVREEKKPAGPILNEANEKYAGSIFDVQTVNYDAYLAALGNAKK